MFLLVSPHFNRIKDVLILDALASNIPVISYLHLEEFVLLLLGSLDVFRIFLVLLVDCFIKETSHLFCRPVEWLIVLHKLRYMHYCCLEK